LEVFWTRVRFPAPPPSTHSTPLDFSAAPGAASTPEVGQIGWQRRFYIALFERLAALGL